MITLRKMVLNVFAICVMFLACVLSVANADTITFYHNDLSGSPLVATDAAGNSLWKENYRPYGDKLNKSPNSASNRIGFHGKPFDNEIGLSYVGARYYDPLIGRFHGVDPKDIDQDNPHSFNRYAYANNNPYRYVDPDGHSPIDIAFLAYDIGKLGAAIYSGTGIAAAAGDVALSAVGVVSPIPGTGQALKAVRAADKGVDAIKAAKGSAGGSRAGKAFTPKGKEQIDAANAERNGGVNVCEKCQAVVVPAKRSQRGVTPPGNQRERDHIIPKSKGGDGDPPNGQILCRDCNQEKRDSYEY